MATLLTNRPTLAGTVVTCYLDQKDIESGTNWETAFLTGLRRSCLFVPIVSTGACTPIEDVSIFDDKADNVLLEIETSLRLWKKKELGILPLLVGSIAPTSSADGIVKCSMVLWA